ncbi:MAG: hypothetical protein KJZ65_06540 [Phycisphaerales bacterium]|nr:hypothetical protein [Phycisphaerales bacterium]
MKQALGRSAGCHALSESSRQGVFGSPRRRARDTRRMRPLVLTLNGDFTIEQACGRTGVRWGTMRLVLARLVREGRVEIVAHRPRPHGNVAYVYRVIPPSDRARFRRRARRIIAPEVRS